MSVTLANKLDNDDLVNLFHILRFFVFIFLSEFTLGHFSFSLLHHKEIVVKYLKKKSGEAPNFTTFRSVIRLT